MYCHFGSKATGRPSTNVGVGLTTKAGFQNRLTLHLLVHLPYCCKQLWNCRKVGIYSLLTHYQALVGNGYIIYDSTDSDTAKGDCNCSRNSHGNSWICSMAVLCLQGILEARLLESFCWDPIRGIPMLTL